MGFLWILGRLGLIFVVFWVSIVLTGFGGGGWVVMVGRCWVDGGICVLVVVLLQVLCVCVGVFVWVCLCLCLCVSKKKKMMSLSFFNLFI